MTGSRTVPGPKSPKKKNQLRKIRRKCKRNFVSCPSFLWFHSRDCVGKHTNPYLFRFIILHLQVEMKLHCCLNSFVSSSCFDALEISSHFPVKSKNEMKRRSISFLYYVICRYRCCPCKKILFMTIAIWFDLLRYGLSLSNFCIATAASQRGCMDRSQWTKRWDAGAAGGHGRVQGNLGRRSSDGRRPRERGKAKQDTSIWRR